MLCLIENSFSEKKHYCSYCIIAVSYFQTALYTPIIIVNITHLLHYMTHSSMNIFLFTVMYNHVSQVNIQCIFSTAVLI